MRPGVVVLTTIFMLMQLRTVYICSLLGMAVCTKAQEAVVDGVVFNQPGTQRVAGAEVKNRRTGAQTFSNTLGLFQLKAAPGDTVDVDKAGFIPGWAVVTTGQDIVLKLQQVIEIDEVTITALSKKQELDEARQQYRKQGSFHSGRPPFLAFLFNPVTAIYELVGKTPRRARRFNQFYYRELEELEIDRRFSTTRITQITKYEGNDLKNFIQTYRPAYAELSKWDEYALVNYIKTSARTFEAAGKPTATSLPPLPKAPYLGDDVPGN